MKLNPGACPGSTGLTMNKRKRLVFAVAACVACVCVWWWWPWPNAWPIGIAPGKSVGTEG